MKVAVSSMSSKGYRKGVSRNKKTCQMRESDENLKSKISRKENIASDTNVERSLKGKLSFLLAHTQACYKDRSNQSTHRGLSF